MRTFSFNDSASPNAIIIDGIIRCHTVPYSCGDAVAVIDPTTVPEYRVIG